MDTQGLTPERMLEEATFMTLRLHLDNYHDVEDAIGDGVLAMLEAQSKAQEGKPLDHYERKSAFGAIHNFYNKNQKRRSHEFLSLTKPQDSGEGDFIENVPELEGDSWEDRMRKTEEALHVRALIGTLPKREREVIQRRFYKEETLEVIGDAMGCTKEYVRLLEKKALETLRHRYQHTC